MNERLLREWVRSCLVEQAQILTIIGSEDDPEKRYPLNKDQARIIKNWIETGMIPDEDVMRGQDWVPIEPHTSEGAKNKILDILPPGKQAQFEKLVGPKKGGGYGEIATKPGGILDALTKLMMEIGEEAVAAAMFAGSFSAPPENSCKPIDLGAAAPLEPLFEVREQGTGDVVGKGEILLAFAFPDTSANPGGDYDVTISSANYHVKDLVGSTLDIPLGKNDWWNPEKGMFPFKQLAGGRKGQKAQLGKLSKGAMEKGFPTVQKIYTDAAKGNASAIDIRDSTISFQGNAANQGDIAKHFSNTLDALVAGSQTYGKASGVIYAREGVLHVCGRKGSYFNRTDRNALRVGPSTLVALENRYPYKAALEYKASNKKKAAAAKELEKIIDATDTRIIALGNPTDEAIKAKIGSAGQARGYLRAKLDIATTTKTEQMTNPWGSINDWEKNSDTGHVKIFDDLREKLGLSLPTTPATPPLETSGKVYDDLRSLIRENLLLEELTKSDKKEIEKLARKQAMAIMDKEGWDKKEIEKLAKKQAEDAIKKALGVSFLGTKGNINKFVTDVTQDTAEKWLKDKATQQQVADIAKKVMKKLYKHLAMSSPQIIDRIKV